MHYIIVCTYIYITYIYSNYIYNYIYTYSVRLKLAPLYKRTEPHHCKSKKVESDLGCFGLIFFPSIFFPSNNCKMMDASRLEVSPPKQELCPQEKIVRLLMIQICLKVMQFQTMVRGITIVTLEGKNIHK